jgi:hypothetical protein
MPELLTSDDVLALLQERKGSRTLEQLSEEIGVSYQYLGHVFRKVRAPGKDMLRFLGLERVVFYRRKARRS